MNFATMTRNNIEVLEELTLKRMKHAANVFRAVNHPLRLEIMKLIKVNGSLTVTQIYLKLRIEQSVASQHLAILRETEVLIATRQGKNIKYSINTERLNAIITCLELLAD